MKKYMGVGIASNFTMDSLLQSQDGSPKRQQKGDTSAPLKLLPRNFGRKKKKDLAGIVTFDHDHVPKHCLFTGESVMATLHRVSLRWSYPGLRRVVQRGRLFLTSFRLFFHTLSRDSEASHSVNVQHSLSSWFGYISIPYMDVIRYTKKSLEYGMSQITLVCRDMKYIKLALEDASAVLAAQFIDLFAVPKSVSDLFAFSYKYLSPLRPYDNTLRGIPQSLLNSANMRSSVASSKGLIERRLKTKTVDININLPPNDEKGESVASPIVSPQSGQKSEGKMRIGDLKKKASAPQESVRQPVPSTTAPIACIISEISPRPSPLRVSSDTSKKTWRTAGSWRPIPSRRMQLGVRSPISVAPQKPADSRRTRGRSMSAASLRSTLSHSPQKTENPKPTKLQSDIWNLRISPDRHSSSSESEESESEHEKGRKPHRSKSVDCLSSLSSSSGVVQVKELRESVSTCDLDGWTLYDPLIEFERMGIPTSAVPGCPLRLTHVNLDYSKSPTYPRYLCVPSQVSDDTLDPVFRFRSKGRIPVICWKKQGKFATLSRCSQPFVGVKGSRCQQDEILINAIRMASQNPTTEISPPLKIVDARPKAAAIGNKAMGAGYEFGGRYENITLEFMGIENIHEIRKSFNALQALVRNRFTTESWMTSLESTGWLSHLRTILKASVYIGKLLSAGNPVMVHCSDGWDRTAQLVSLAELLIDPYYRTIVGFEVLMEKEWLSYGHKFAQRNGHHEGQKLTSSERSPIFLQFLDCVSQILSQFPNYFEFNEYFLIAIMDNMTSCRFGTFLGNCDRERMSMKVRMRTVSLWTELNSKNEIGKYRNPRYREYLGDLHLSASSSDLAIWKTYFFRWNDSRRPEHSLPMLMYDNQQLANAPLVQQSVPSQRPSFSHQNSSTKSAVDTLTTTTSSSSASSVTSSSSSSVSSSSSSSSSSLANPSSSSSSAKPLFSGAATAPLPPARPHKDTANVTVGDPKRLPLSPTPSLPLSPTPSLPHSSSLSPSVSQPVLHNEPPIWVPDRWAEVCSDCRRIFNHLRRRHHCRACGKIFCGKCTPHTLPLPEYNLVGPKRVCVSCYDARGGQSK